MTSYYGKHICKMAKAPVQTWSVKAPLVSETANNRKGSRKPCFLENEYQSSIEQKILLSLMEYCFEIYLNFYDSEKTIKLTVQPYFIIPIGFGLKSLLSR